MALGAALLVAAACLAVFNLWDDWRAGQQAAKTLSAFPGPTVVEKAGIDPDADMPTVWIDGYEYVGVLEVPDLGLQLPILSSWSDELLRVAPCRYVGTAYANNMVIAGHNYRSHFGGLRRLEPGAHLSFTDTVGNRFVYEVTASEVVQPYDIEGMVGKGGEGSQGWDLTLFTCTYGGQTRYTVRCKRVAEGPVEAG